MHQQRLKGANQFELHGIQQTFSRRVAILSTCAGLLCKLEHAQDNWLESGAGVGVLSTPPSYKFSNSPPVHPANTDYLEQPAFSNKSIAISCNTGSGAGIQIGFKAVTEKMSAS